MTTQPSIGKVYLVGAGPGDPELMTLKAKRVLGEADVILYDYLVDNRIMQWIKPEAECIDVGKSGLTGHKMKQHETQALMIEKAQQGHVVVRLKGGDPYIFGRGGEEGEDLFDHNIPFEVVPGITSAIAVPAYAGIPVTHRDVNSSFTVITGHEDPNKPESFLDYPTLAKLPGTLVFLMGVKQLPQIAEALIANGKSPKTPVGVVQWGTRPQQVTVTGNLETIAVEIEKAGLLPPCIIIIGDVVNYRQKLNWFENLPLLGQTVVVTRARDQASTFRQKLESQGAAVIELPTIHLIPTEPSTEFDQQLKTLGDHDWLLLTSPNAVSLLFKNLFRLGMDARDLANVNIGVIGIATEEALNKYGLKADLLPKEYVAESLIESLTERIPDFKSLKFFLPRADIARPYLKEELLKLGANVTELALYQTIQPELDDHHLGELKTALENKKLNWLTFTSSSTVNNFAALVEPMLSENPEILKGIKVASIGPVTSKTAFEKLGRVDTEAKVFTIDGLVQALLTYTNKQAIPA